MQSIIDNLHYILPGIALVLWSLARLVDAMARRNPAHDRWDDVAPKLQWASDMYSRALDWLIQAGYGKWSGAEKLKILNDKLKIFERLCNEGKYLEAIADVTGFHRAAEDKLEKATATLPFRQSGPVGTDRPIGPDDVATDGNTSGPGPSNPPIPFSK